MKKEEEEGKEQTKRGRCQQGGPPRLQVANTHYFNVHTSVCTTRLVFACFHLHLFTGAQMRENRIVQRRTGSPTPALLLPSPCSCRLPVLLESIRGI